MLSVPTKMTGYLKRPVGILGYGVSGRAAERLLLQLGITPVLFDSKAEGCRSEFNESLAAEYGLVIYSPGFPLTHPWLVAARKAGCKVVTEFDFGASFWKGESVAITGTNGKTTSTMFLVEALQAAGCQAVGVGNIGYPFSSLIDEWGSGEGVTAVCEVSSFQAECLEYFEADALLWTNFAEDHLDHHSSMSEYFQAKLGLVNRLRSDCFIAGKSVQECAIGYDMALPAYAKIVSRPPLKEAEGMLGVPPYINNYAIVEEYWRYKGLDDFMLKKIAAGFTLPNHRMTKVLELDECTYWNDSKATNFDAVYGALSLFNDKILWIGGGKDKGGDLVSFVENIYTKIGGAYLIGQTGKSLAVLLRAKGVNANYFETLLEATEKAREDSVKSSNIVLSPGFSSYDMFPSYSHRGNCFEEYVLGLKNPMKCAS